MPLLQHRNEDAAGGFSVDVSAGERARSLQTHSRKPVMKCSKELLETC